MHVSVWLVMLTIDLQCRIRAGQDSCLVCETTGIKCDLDAARDRRRGTHKAKERVEAATLRKVIDILHLPFTTEYRMVLKWLQQGISVDSLCSRLEEPEWSELLLAESRREQGIIAVNDILNRETAAEHPPDRHISTHIQPFSTHTAQEKSRGHM